ncbi:MAG: hypothetical protein A2167_05430 [Planctomycetes bacterium RBG_13_46_10]|nr:MAG: hypothetical protein A2167_05430 [Planctomycetes bacterium RBG_13_46_10]
MQPRLIQLTQNEVALVDAADYPELSRFKWFAKWTGRNGAIYAARSLKKDHKTKTVYMHRLITGALAGEEVDHDDGKTLNNQRGNLKVTTKAENLKNRVYGKIGARNHNALAAAV